MNENQLEIERNAIANAYAYSRVSSTKQLKGTGMVRQQEGKPEAICKEHGWLLSPQTFADFGVSAFKGKNRLKGDLATFVKLAEEKKLLPYPVLIMEQWDRFSRQDIDESEAAVMDLLRSGVAIHIAFANETFTKSSVKDIGARIKIMLACKSAYEYSANLSKRVKAAYDKKKEVSAESGKAYRFKAPGWLCWDGTKSDYVTFDGWKKWDKESRRLIYLDKYDPTLDKVKSIRRLFELANKGLGVRGVVKRLNAEHATPIANYNGAKIKSGKWSNVVVAGLLHSQKVLGINENVTPPVKMYPEVIKPEVYYAALNKIYERRTGKFYGRNSDDGRNLFLHMAECKCGRRMCMHQIKTGDDRRNPETAGTRGGTGARGGKSIHTYLICEGYLAGTCTTKQIKYEWTEESFVAAVSCSVHTLSLADSKASTPDGKDTEMLKGQLAETRQKLGEYTKDYEETPSKALAGLMVKAETEESRLLAELENATTIELGSTPISEAKQELLELMYKDWNAVDTRLRARELIRTLAEKIVVDIAKQSYLIHWKGYAKPTHVELAKRGLKRGAKLTGYTINGTYYPSMGRDWQKATSAIAAYAKQVEAEPLPLVVVP